MTYVFDIDGTICAKDKFEDTDYESSKPIKDRVAVVNKLYDEGHTIIFQTARGMGRFNNDASKAIEMFYDFTVLWTWVRSGFGGEVKNPYFDVISNRYSDHRNIFKKNLFATFFYSL